jgi:hypothetical protein
MGFERLGYGGHAVDLVASRGFKFFPLWPQESDLVSVPSIRHNFKRKGSEQKFQILYPIAVF